MFTWKEALVERARHDDLLREARNARLAALFTTGETRHDRIGYEVLCWLGEKMVAWGSGLQEKYGACPKRAWQNLPMTCGVGGGGRCGEPCCSTGATP